jgi:mannose-6-phosphate isomerase-like protein (cupin superfamily)
MLVTDIGQHRGAFFRVLQQTARSQAAVMTIEPGGDAGPAEEHDGDQILYVVDGEALVTVGEEQRRGGPGTLVTVPARTRHHVANAGTGPLFVLTVYAPPEY